MPMFVYSCDYLALSVVNYILPVSFFIYCRFKNSAATVFVIVPHELHIVNNVTHNAPKCTILRAKVETPSPLPTSLVACGHSPLLPLGKNPAGAHVCCSKFFYNTYYISTLRRQ